MPGKQPTVKWEEFKTRIATPGELTFNGSMALICGHVSGNVECFDIDTKHDKKLEKRVKEAFGDFFKEITDAVLVQKTISGGYHFVYRCAEIGRNQKLARNAAGEVILETRSEGGYIVIAPTEGYKVMRGSFMDIPEISPALRQKLFDYARTLNEHFVEVEQLQPKKDAVDTMAGEKPGEHYNRETDAIPDILRRTGWTLVKENRRQQLWKRPGTTDSMWSGSFSPEHNTFYVYTSSVPQLQQEKAYRPFSLLTMLQYNGDWSTAASDLYQQGYGARHERQSAQELHDFDSPQPQQEPQQPAPVPQKPKGPQSLEDMEEIWSDVFLSEEPPADVVLIEIQGVPAATAGNHSLVIGKKKSRKSLFITWLISQYAGDPGAEVILFDTEQGKRHVWKLAQKVKQMTGKTVPVAYLRGKSLQDRKMIIERTLKFWPTKVKLIVIDGIRDLISNINDPDQSTDLILWLEQLTLNYGIHVINVLHLNKTDNNARGHIGSELLNKAEITIELEKDDTTGCTIVKCESSRDKPFEDFAFTHGQDDLPELVGTPTPKGGVSDAERRDRACQAFEDGPLPYATALKEIQTSFSVGANKAGALLKDFMRDGWVVKNGSSHKKDTVYKLMIACPPKPKPGDPLTEEEKNLPL